MKQYAIIGILTLLAACGSDNDPQPSNEETVDMSFKGVVKYQDVTIENAWVRTRNPVTSAVRTNDQGFYQLKTGDIFVDGTSDTIELVATFPFNEPFTQIIDIGGDRGSVEREFAINLGAPRNRDINRPIASVEFDELGNIDGERQVRLPQTTINNYEVNFYISTPVPGNYTVQNTNGQFTVSPSSFELNSLEDTERLTVIYTGANTPVDASLGSFLVLNDVADPLELEVVISDDVSDPTYTSGTVVTPGTDVQPVTVSSECPAITCDLINSSYLTARNCATVGGIIEVSWDIGQLQNLPVTANEIQLRIVNVQQLLPTDIQKNNIPTSAGKIDLDIPWALGIHHIELWDVNTSERLDYIELEINKAQLKLVPDEPVPSSMQDVYAGGKGDILLCGAGKSSRTGHKLSFYQSNLVTDELETRNESITTVRQSAQPDDELVPIAVDIPWGLGQHQLWLEKGNSGNLAEDNTIDFKKARIDTKLTDDGKILVTWTGAKHGNFELHLLQASTDRLIDRTQILESENQVDWEFTPPGSGNYAITLKNEPYDERGEPVEFGRVEITIP